MSKLEKSDIVTLLKVAKAALEHEVTSDMVCRALDLSEAEMDRLYGLIADYLEDK